MPSLWQEPSAYNLKSAVSLASLVMEAFLESSIVVVSVSLSRIGFGVVFMVSILRLLVWNSLSSLNSRLRRVVGGDCAYLRIML